MLSSQDLDCSDVISMFVFLREALGQAIAPLPSLAPEVPVGGNKIVLQQKETLLVCVCVCTRTRVRINCRHKCACQRGHLGSLGEDIRAPGAGVSGSCKQTNMGSEIPTWVPYKGSARS